MFIHSVKSLKDYTVVIKTWSINGDFSELVLVTIIVFFLIFFLKRAEKSEHFLLKFRIYSARVSGHFISTQQSRLSAKPPQTYFLITCHVSSGFKRSLHFEKITVKHNGFKLLFEKFKFSEKQDTFDRRANSYQSPGFLQTGHRQMTCVKQRRTCRRSCRSGSVFRRDTSTDRRSFPRVIRTVNHRLSAM